MPKADEFEPWLPDQVVIEVPELVYGRNPYTGQNLRELFLNKDQQFHLFSFIQLTVKSAITGGIRYASDDDRLR